MNFQEISSAVSRIKELSGLISRASESLAALGHPSTESRLTGSSITIPVSNEVARMLFAGYIETLKNEDRELRKKIGADQNP